MRISGFGNKPARLASRRDDDASLRCDEGSWRMHFRFTPPSRNARRARANGRRA
jgi:hypothetical protein